MRLSALTWCRTTRTLALAMVLGAASMDFAWSDESAIRIGMPSFPAGGGVPLSGYALPSVLTYSALFDGLTILDNSGEFQPGLATGWSQVDDLTWRFDLRHGVRFSNGEPFDANTVAFFVDLLNRPESAVYPVQRELGILASSRVIDSHQIELTTSSPSPLLPRVLSAMRVVPPEYWDAVGAEAFKTAPVGTGPFAVQEWTSSKILLTGQPSSWRAPRTQHIELLRIPESTSRLNALLAEDVDIALGLAPDDKPILESVNAALQGRQLGNIVVWTFITADENPLRDVRVRRALNMAVDRDTLIAAFLNDSARPANQAALPEAFGFNSDLPPLKYDPEAAKALLKEAGYPDGFSMTVEVVLGGIPNDSAIYQQIGSYFGAVGVDIEIRTITLTQLVTGIGEGQWNGQSFNLDFSLLPALDGISPLRIHSCLKRVAWFCDPAATPLLNSVFAEADLMKREALTRDVQTYVHSELPALILFEGIAFDGVRSTITGYSGDFGWIPFHEMEKQEAASQ